MKIVERERPAPKVTNPDWHQSPCINHGGYIGPGGYGCIHLPAGNVMAHRLAYERAKGPIPAELEIDHLCHNRACVQPDHLQVVTHAENQRRTRPALKEYCKHGHRYDKANTHIGTTGKRDCRKCMAARQKRWRDRQKVRNASLTAHYGNETP